MISKELRKKIKELEPYLNSGKPAPANDIIDTYNLFHKPDPRTGRKVGYTSCGSCLRKYLTEMVDAVKIEEDRERTEKARLAKEKKEQKQKEAEASAD